MCLDKDLKGINDRCGHQEGDALIIAAGYAVQRRRSARLRFFLVDGTVSLYDRRRESVRTEKRFRRQKGMRK